MASQPTTAQSMTNRPPMCHKKKKRARGLPQSTQHHCREQTAAGSARSQLLTSKPKFAHVLAHVQIRLSFFFVQPVSTVAALRHSAAIPRFTPGRWIHLASVLKRTDRRSSSRTRFGPEVAFNFFPSVIPNGTDRLPR